MTKLASSTAFTRSSTPNFNALYDEVRSFEHDHPNVRMVSFGPFVKAERGNLLCYAEIPLLQSMYDHSRCFGLREALDVVRDGMNLGWFRGLSPAILETWSDSERVLVEAVSERFQEQPSF